VQVLNSGPVKVVLKRSLLISSFFFPSLQTYGAGGWGDRETAVVGLWAAVSGGTGAGQASTTESSREMREETGRPARATTQHKPCAQHWPLFKVIGEFLGCVGFFGCGFFCVWVFCVWVFLGVGFFVCGFFLYGAFSKCPSPWQRLNNGHSKFIFSTFCSSFTFFVLNLMS
jgi:hypothetical protein